MATFGISLNRLKFMCIEYVSTEKYPSTTRGQIRMN